MLGSLGLLHLTYSSSSSGFLSSSKDYPSPRLSHPKLPSFPLLRHRVLCPPSNLRCGKLERDCKVRAVLTDDSSRMTMSEGEMEDIVVLRTDSNLEPYKDHFKYRINRYLEQKSLIEKFEGGLEEFARGFVKFGFNREDGGVVYREWPPAAHRSAETVHLLSYLL